MTSWMETLQPLWTTCSSVQTLITVKKKKEGKKSVFLCLDRTQNFLCFSLCLLPLVLSLYSMERSLALSSLLPPHQAFKHVDKIPLRLPVSRLDSPSPLSLSPYKKPSKPLMVFLSLCCTCSGNLCLSCTGEPRTGHHSRCASPELSRREGSPALACW